MLFAECESFLSISMRYGKSLHLPEVLDVVVPVLVVVLVGVVAVVVVELTPASENKYHKAKMTLTALKQKLVCLSIFIFCYTENFRCKCIKMIQVMFNCGNPDRAMFNKRSIDECR